MKKGIALVVLSIFLIMLVITPLSINAEWDVDEEEHPIGYKIINDTVMIWNPDAPYYFNKSSGIQFTNHYEEYWTKNVFCLGYYSGEEWVKIKCADELNNFNRDIETDNLTYVNATLWKNFTYSGYDLRFGVRYSLGINDTQMGVTINIKNLDNEAIPYDLGFAWKIKNVSIPSTDGKSQPYGDSIDINGTRYPFSDSFDLTFKNMSNYYYDPETLEKKVHYRPQLRMQDWTEYLTLDWNENLDYEVKIYSNGTQESFYTMLIINGGSFAAGQEKETTILWKDAFGDFIDSWAQTAAAAPLSYGMNSTNILINQRNSDNIQYYTMNGSYLGAYSITILTGRGIDSNDTNAFVIDYGANKMNMYAPAGGANIRSTAVAANSYGLTNDGTYFYTMASGNIVYQYNMNDGSATGFSKNMDTEMGAGTVRGIAYWNGYMYFSDGTDKLVYQTNMTMNYTGLNWSYSGTAIADSYGLFTNGTDMWIGDPTTAAVYRFEGPEPAPATSLKIAYPINGTNYYTTNISELNYTTGADDRCWYSNSSGVTNSTDVAAGTNFTNVVSVLGSNNWTVYCNDTSNNIISNVTFFNWTLLVPFSLTIFSPQNITYDSSSILFNISGTNLSFCEFTINDWATNYTMEISLPPGDTAYANYTNSSMLDGQYTSKFLCNDTLNNMSDATNITFTIDLTPPNISIVYPVNGTNYTTNVSELNYTVVDVASDRCWYSNSSGVTNSTDVAAGTNFTNVIPVTGTNNWTVYCNDTVNHLNSSVVNFNWDIVTPNMTLISPVNYTNTSLTTINFTANFTDNYELKNATLIIYNLGTADLNYSYYNFSSGISSSDLGLNFTFTLDGTYQWWYEAVDWIGNLNTSIAENHTIKIDTVAPKVYITYPVNQTNYTINVSYIEYSLAVDTGSVNMLCWYSNNSGVTNFSYQYYPANYNFTNIVPLVGTNNWTVYCNDSANNVGQNITYFNWDIVNPNATFVSPDNNIITPNLTINFTVNLLDDYELKNATLYIYNSSGDLFNSTVVTFVAGTTTKTLGIVVTLIDGIYTWVYTVFDWLGNEGENMSDLNVGLKSYWGFNGINLTDPVSLNSVNGTLNATTGGTHLYGYNKTTSGLIGNALEIIASGGGSRYLNTSVNFPSSIDTSFSFWMYDAGGESQDPALFYGGFEDAPSYIYWDTSAFIIRLGAVGIPNASEPTAGGSAVWTHYVVTYNDDTGISNMYRNGTFVGSGAGNDLTLDGILLMFNTHALGDYWNGGVDEVGIWNRTLSSTEVTWLYNNGSGLSYPYGNRTLTVDTTPPLLGIVYPENNTYYNNVSELNYTIVDVASDRCWYSNSSGVTNSSNVAAGTNFTNVVPDSGHNTWTVYCNDSLNNLNSSSVQWTWDYSPFLVTNAPIGTSFVSADNASIDVTTTGQYGIIEIYTYINDSNYSGGFFMNFSSNNEGANISMTGAIINTSYSDAKSIIHNTSSITRILNRSLLIPMTNGVGEVYICPNASTFTEINASCPGKTTLAIGETENGMTMTNVSVNGTYYYKVINITGTGGGEGSAPTLTNGNVTPQIGNTVTVFYYNVTYTDAENDTAQFVYVNINGTNYTMTEFNSSDQNVTDGKVYNYSTVLPNGTHNFSFWAEDEANVSVNTTTYTGPVVDITPPQIDIISPLNQSYNTTSIVFNVSGNERLTSCNFTINAGATNYTMTNLTTVEYNYTNSSMDEAQYTAQFFCSNEVDLINNTESVTFIIDTTYPQINYTFPTPSSGTNQSFDSIYINVTVNETNEGNITYLLHNKTGQAYKNTYSTAVRYINWTNLRDGIYYFNVTLNDTAGNSNTTDTRRVIVDTLNPNVSLVAPSNNTNTNNVSLNFTALMNDSGGIKNATLYIYNSSGDLYNSTTISFIAGTTTKTLGIVVTLIDGVYTWFFQVFDWVDQSTTAGNYTLTIDNSSPVLNVTYPGLKINYHRNATNLTINWSYTESNPDTCFLDYSGSNFSINCTDNSSIYHPINITTFTNRNITFWMNDTFGNTASFQRNWTYKVYEKDNSTYDNNSYRGSELMNWSYEGESKTYVLNMSTDGDETVNAYLVYNGTSYLATRNDTTTNDSVIFSRTINIPMLGQANTSWFWNVIYGSESINTTYLHNESIIPVSLVRCNSSVNSPYAFFDFRDEVNTSKYIDAASDLVGWTYWLNNSLYNNTYTFVNVTDNFNYSYCFTPENRTMYGEVDYQYSATSYPLRSWHNYSISIPANDTAIHQYNQTLWLLNTVDGQYVTFQVIDTADTPIEDANISITRNILGTVAEVGYDTTDATGRATFFLNFAQAHTITAAADSCTISTSVITPTETSYIITLACGTSPTVGGGSSIEGVTYTRAPIVGGVAPATNDTIFEFYVISLIYDIIKAKMELYYANGTFISSNETYASINTSTCNATACYITLLRNTTKGDDIKARYYVAVNNTATNSTGYVLLEADARWRFLNSTANSFTTIKNFMTLTSQLFTSWHPAGDDPLTNWDDWAVLNCEQYIAEATCGGGGCEWDEAGNVCYDFNLVNRLEYSRLVAIFLALAIVLTVFGRMTGYDDRNPGSFLLILTFVVALGTFSNGLVGPGYFFYKDLTPFALINNTLLFFSLALFSAGYWASLTRRYT